MDVKITYKTDDNAIFVGVTKIVEKIDAFGVANSFALYSDEGLLYLAIKSAVKEISVLV